MSSVNTALVADAADVGFKVFVGNLSFNTKDTDLKEVFGKAGQVATAQVIYRGPRSLGYGFVEFANEADATKAVSTLDKSELDGRQINVELAKPPTSTPAGRAPREAAAAAVASDATSATVVQENGGEAKPKKKSKPRRKGARKPRTDGETEEAGDAPVADITSKLESTKLDTPAAPAAEGDDSAPKTGSTRGRGGRRGGRGGARGGAATGERRERRAPTGLPSKTLLFVANLAFSVTDDQLKALFEPYGVVSAHVVTKKFGHDSGRSKGFGFVEVQSEELQQKALAELQGKEVEGRELSIKVALQQEKVEEEEKLGDGDTGLGAGEIIAQ